MEPPTGSAGVRAPPPHRALIASHRARQALVLGLSGYGALCLRNAERFRLLDSVDLAIHETGHLVFAPFGEFLGFAGGTLFQLLFPLFFVFYFRRRADAFASSVVLAWVAQNLWNVSVYVADARARRLPLVGGGEHDWAYLLGRLGLLEQDHAIADALHFAGVLLFGWCMWRAFEEASRTAPATDAELPVPPSVLDTPAGPARS